MPGTQNKPVTIQPAGRSRITHQTLAKKHSSDFGRPQGQTKVAGRAFMDGVHGKTTGFVGS
jgi:hypothetical protein